MGSLAAFVSSNSRFPLLTSHLDKVFHLMRWLKLSFLWDLNPYMFVLSCKNFLWPGLLGKRVPRGALVDLCISNIVLHVSIR